MVSIVNACIRYGLICSSGRTEYRAAVVAAWH